MGDKRPQFPIRILALLFPFIGFYIVWMLCALLLGPERLPGPGRIAALVFESLLRNAVIFTQGGGSHGFLPHIVSTFVHTCAGCGLGIVTGLFSAIVLSNSRSTFWVFDSLIEIIRVLPPLIFIPFAVIIFGSSYTVKIVSVFLYSYFSMGMYTLSSLSNVPEEYLALSRLLGAGRTRTLLMTKLPAILPDLIGPLRVIVSLGLGISVVAEFLAAPTGIGRVMKFAMSYGRVDLILVGIVWAIFLVLLLDCGIGLGAHFALPWMTQKKRLEIETKH